MNCCIANCLKNIAAESRARALLVEFGLKVLYWELGNSWSVL